MILRQNTIIFSLDIKSSVFTTMSSLLIYYSWIFQCPFLSKLHALCGHSVTAGFSRDTGPILDLFKLPGCDETRLLNTDSRQIK